MKPLDHLCLVVGSVWLETLLVRSHRYRFQNIAHSKVLFFVKKQRTVERKKRSKGRGWESCYVKKNYGTFGVEIRAYGRNWSNFAHTRG